ncbi:hypothetical protein [Pseudoteredinibacter isoporae]|uniref:Putative transcriptional regulator n=1 Tax=Pseudoteredinibacter isoporae TaxID=570281 RepID=A0A7X0JVF7_9GAMM|nr:hypothetical protein [Pseudoteredinibacter isoporae]MBB6522131.1 putative transcriptional regulator [Pseudoteredinibacter isoporae]NHO87666.1 hypothetical protein [Pseudoteredinibacter isoporae]NIB24003.1 hypothetical protein [Pseudoteredinibacter isoporae]
MTKFIKTFAVISIAALSLTACDKINNANRTMDTMLGGDFKVYIAGHNKVYTVTNGKVTSVPEKGYYVFYANVDGKKRLVQSPIATTTIEKID